ncbi:MAG TPA: hypothetical protein VFE47_28735 [Tepidisphaeraceae bacterium]|jgi:hypothetical protein|nr:hypothetical protein [Tepidisphaeraceae bacterium]
MKTIRKIGSLALLLGCAGSVWAAGWPQSPRYESSKPVAAGASVTLAEPYKILLTRSIFSRDGRAQPIAYRRPTPVALPPTTTPSTQPAAAWVTPDPEAGYILRGVGMEDGVFSAFFEQTTENKGYVKHVGDTVARGKIMAMSLDGIDYELKNKVSRVIIGQALDGHMPAVMASATTGGSERTSRWIHHDTPGATPPGATPQGPGAEPWRGGQQSRGGDPRGNESRTNESRGGDSRNADSRFNRERSRDQERPRNGEQDKSRTEGPQGPETTERPEARPTEPGPQGPGPGPEADDLPVIIIDPN